MLTVLSPKNLPVEPAVALDQIAAGKPHSAADTIAQRLKSEGARAEPVGRFVEPGTLEPEGPSLLVRSEAVERRG